MIIGCDRPAVKNEKCLIPRWNLASCLNEDGIVSLSLSHCPCIVVAQAASFHHGNGRCSMMAKECIIESSRRECTTAARETPSWQQERLHCGVKLCHRIGSRENPPRRKSSIIATDFIMEAGETLSRRHRRPCHGSMKGSIMAADSSMK